MLAASLGWSHGWIRLFTLLLILCVPIIVTLAWYHGARGQQRASGTEVMIIALLIALGGAFLWRDSSDHELITETDTVATVVPTGDLSVAPGDMNEKSIAVLPFVNISSDKEQEYFSDGLSEELLNVLVKVPELRVAARTSSFYFKGKNALLPDIARELQVANLLEGSVRKSGNRVRITAQLVRGSDGYHQWSETYDRTLEDIFAVQEEIAAAVVSQLKLSLLGPAAQIRTTDPDAYVFYLRALQVDRLAENRFEESRALYQKVLDIDPTFVPAWYGLGAMYANQANYGERPLAEGMEQSRSMFSKAIEIDPQNSQAYAGLGWISVNYDLDLQAAARHCERALSLSATDPETLRVAAALSRALGQTDSVLAAIEYFVRRDPLNPVALLELSGTYLDAGRLDASIKIARAALHLNPSTFGMHAMIGDALWLKGDYTGALAAYSKESTEPLKLAGLASTHFALGDRSKADPILSELVKKYSNWPYLIAAVYAQRRDNVRAFEWLQKAVNIRDSSLMSVTDSVWVQSLHDDPRWLPFLRGIGRAPEQVAAVKFDLKVPST
jgi:TolB-like protein